ncbi:MAG: HAD family hydrolase [Phycisphaeraceae bacterium]|nr:HAD family hydrolase [Phycisphaeraceae bacterium]
MLKAIVFDFDGVIVDTERLHHEAFLEVVAPFGVRFDYREYVEHLIGYDDRDVFRVLLARAAGAAGDCGPAAFDGDPARIEALKQEKGEVFARMATQSAVPIPGVLEFLDDIASRVPAAISSGATAGDIGLILGGLQRRDRFDPIVTADDVTRSKPDPECYRRAVEGLAVRHPDLDLQPGDCLAIEDTPAGIEAARRAGLRVLGLATSMPEGQLRGADRVIGSFDEISFESLRAWFDA